MLFRVYGVEKDETCVVHYAKVPLALTADTTQVEVPDVAREAVLLDAERRCWLKVLVRDRADKAYALYEREIEKVKRDMLSKKHHPYGSVKNTMWRFSGGRVRGYDSYRYGEHTYTD